MDPLELELRRSQSSLLVIKNEGRTCVNSLTMKIYESVKGHDESLERDQVFDLVHDYRIKHRELNRSLTTDIAEYRSHFWRCKDAKEREKLFLDTAMNINKSYNDLIERCRHLYRCVQNRFGGPTHKRSEIKHIDFAMRLQEEWLDRLWGLFNARIMLLNHDAVTKRFFSDEWRSLLASYQCKHIKEARIIHGECFGYMFREHKNKANKPAYYRLYVRERRAVLAKMESTLLDLNEAIKKAHSKDFSLKCAPLFEAGNQTVTVTVPLTMICPICSSTIEFYRHLDFWGIP